MTKECASLQEPAGLSPYNGVPQGEWDTCQMEGFEDTWKLASENKASEI